MTVSLSVVLPTYDDLQGVFFTVESLRLQRIHSGFDHEILVLDNNPASDQGQRTKEYCDRAKVRYLAMAEPVGAANAKDAAIRAAKGDVVVCLDSHVLLEPGSLSNIASYFSNEHCRRHLVHGVLQKIEEDSVASHFSDHWGSAMRGQWAEAWYSEEWGQVTVTEAVIPGKPSKTALASLDFREMREVLDVPYWPTELRDKELKARGIVPHCRRGVLSSIHGASSPAIAFSIPAMGCGAFACWKDHWVGFNPDFRGFGGEEWYLQDKWRKVHGGSAGQGDVVCLLGFRWIHYFRPASDVKYPITEYNKVRNYVIGRFELGQPLDDVRHHFVEERGFSSKAWDYLVKECSEGRVPAANTMPGLAGATAGKSCGGCGSSFSAPKIESLDAWFIMAKETPSDINEHCETLKRLASEFDHVTEFGMRHGVSTVALAAGVKKKLVSYDSKRYGEAAILESLTPKFVFVEGDSLKSKIEETDLLFIDTRHTAEHVYAELTRHHEKVRAKIVLHDTVIFGERGEDGGPGLLVGLRQFLREHPEWSVVEHHQNNNGLTVISRRPEDKPRLPSLAKQAWNYGKAVLQHAASGSKKLSLPQVEARLEVCSTCPQRVENRCSVCGCYLDATDDREGKALWADQECPLGYWPKVEEAA